MAARSLPARAYAIPVVDGAVSRASRAAELRGFVRGLRRDWNAVQASLRLPWSNGQTEGHIHRLKLVTRHMAGRARLDLLRKRFLLTA